MATTHTSLADLFTDIANKIRLKTGSSAALVADEFPTAIESIVTDPSGSCTAQDSDILLGKTTYSGNLLRTGTIQEWEGDILPPLLCFTANTAGSTISMKVNGTLTLDQNFQTSVDSQSWVDFTPGTTTITLSNIGDKVYFRGNNPNGVNESTSKYYLFVMTGSVAASGNIMSLIDNGDCTCTTIPNNYCFVRMFFQCSSLTRPPELPATTLKNSCYGYMFYSCESLTASPVLPAIKMENGCYEYMFFGCTSLTIAPELPATTLDQYCYASMFKGCSALQAAPELPAETLANYCYAEIFKDCTSLTSLPALPASTMYNSPYLGMFSGCTSLQVSDTLTAEAQYEWRIPTADTFTHNHTQMLMFKYCAGTRSSESLEAIAGQSRTYYTQNPPV